MKRIYSNYSDEEYELIEQKAKELGFTVSAYQKYILMLDIGKSTDDVNLVKLKEKMIDHFKKMEVRSTFIVSSLLPVEWYTLGRNDKMTLAKQFALYERTHDDVEIFRAATGQTTVYIKVK